MNGILALFIIFIMCILVGLIAAMPFVFYCIIKGKI